MPLLHIAYGCNTIKHEQRLIGIGRRSEVCQQVFVILALAITDKRLQPGTAQQASCSFDIDEAQPHQSPIITDGSLGHVPVRWRTRSAHACAIGRHAWMRSGSAARTAAVTS